MKLALVGRDGVINQPLEGGVNHRRQLQFIEGSVAALSTLSKAGYTVIMVTHQPGISRGLFDLDELEAIHSEIMNAVEEQGGQIAAIFYCPHDEQDRCHCRPPSPGLLDVIEIEFDCDTANAVYFYHSDNEKQMIEAKGCQAVLCDAEGNRLADVINKII